MPKYREFLKPSQTWYTVRILKDKETMYLRSFFRFGQFEYHRVYHQVVNLEDFGTIGKVRRVSPKAKYKGFKRCKDV